MGLVGEMRLPVLDVRLPFPRDSWTRPVCWWKRRGGVVEGSAWLATQS